MRDTQEYAEYKEQRNGLLLQSVIFLHASGLSIRKIVEKLSELQKPLSKSTVERIIKKNRARLCASPPETKKLPPQNEPTVCIQKNIRKVSKLIDSPNPPSIREKGRRLRISARSVSRILAKNLDAKLLKKKKVHALSATQAVQRAQRARTFLRYLSRRKLKFLLTMDEMWITTDDLSGQTDYYYKRKNVVVPESWQKLPRKNWPKKVMLAMGISWRGQTAMYVVPPETKVDHKVFIDLVLKPMIRKDVPRLYGSDAKKVVLHMDSALPTFKLLNLIFNFVHLKRLINSENNQKFTDYSFFENLANPGFPTAS
ncbi:uncharacterized protein LOC129593695 [Paramacrobiotus metropolitanus]|uniref:uncharacterized protein LOC129593695 n=1 Tax=Paramacrobiotus metropolitanus TaxID=2943436 RepID=UPI0024460E4A|nr:uncharacterized protein LOC129593695 [Paramacrobiotus metropolitanus]